MDQSEKVKAARQFAQAWKGKGYEKGDAQVFWTELLRDVVGMPRVSSSAKFEYRTSDGGFIDCLIPDSRVLIEQKGLNIDLDKPEERQGRMVTPFEQALAYAESFKQDKQPLFIVTCNFDTFRVYDRNAYPKSKLAEHPFEFTLEELAEHPEYLGFITDPANSRMEKEKAVSIKAGQLIGKLYDALRTQYIDPDSDDSRHSLNVLCVRLVFCLFCEDSRGLFPPDAFLNYLRDVPPENVRPALQRLFAALNTPKEKRDPYDERVKPFPYVNGGLFEEECEIPNFTAEIKDLLLFECSQQTDWSKISPTIFGGIFESTLNPETRRSGGMHYTSPENIHKVIDPLFLDALHNEFNSIRIEEGITEKKRMNKLREFREKIGSLRFLDPACGSGNFLTETYLSLRRLEDDVMNVLNDGQMSIVFETEDNDKRVSLDQFYGIEINDFAVRVAKTALWIAQLQSNDESESMLDISIEDFPLKDSANVVEGNALRMDWNDVLQADKCDYIMGNPPFIGYSNLSKEQQADREEIFGKGCKVLDYVACWYKKAADYIGEFPIRCAFVSTNSITQGQQVESLWKPLFDSGIHIDFAWPTFVWDSEANDKAHVHVVIVGFSREYDGPRRLFGEGDVREVENINGYLAPAANVFVTRRSHPICDVKPAVRGCQPTDDGNLTLSPEERDELIRQEPAAEKWIRPFSMGAEFINGKNRYCLWLVDVQPSDLRAMPLVANRVNKVKEMRLASSKAATRKKAETPWLFDEIRPPKGDSYLAIPKVSSERRKYVPIGFVTNGMVPGDMLFSVSDASLYEFGILMSQMHNAWMRVVAGRLKSDYRYTNTIVYNNFIWPDVDEQDRKRIEDAAQAILDARANHPGESYADLYDPDFMPPDLRAAHNKLDAAVEEAYGVDFDGDEEKIVAHLFKLYAEATEEC